MGSKGQVEVSASLTARAGGCTVEAERRYAGAGAMKLAITGLKVA
jgi:hypothetical protein